MQGWIEGLQSSIDFIEQHLTDELDIEEIAGKAALSPLLLPAHLRRSVRNDRRRIHPCAQDVAGSAGIGENKREGDRYCTQIRI